MLTALVLMLTISTPQTGTTVSLPDTPQGHRVKAFIDAFNTGDEKTFLAMEEEQMTADVLKRRPVEERAKMFQRLRGDFGKLRVASVTKASPERIELTIPTQGGEDAVFSFTFEREKPFKISSISVQVGS